jgi:hypothetical protein
MLSREATDTNFTYSVLIGISTVGHSLTWEKGEKVFLKN